MDDTKLGREYFPGASFRGIAAHERPALVKFMQGI